MHKAYAEAIDILMSDNVDYKEIAVALAKACPEVFVGIANGKRVTVKVDDAAYENFKREILTLIGAGEKIAAIKHCRTLTGYGLKEAKDYCDALDNGDEVVTPACFKGAFKTSMEIDVEEIRKLASASLAKSEKSHRYEDEGEFQ